MKRQLRRVLRRLRPPARRPPRFNGQLLDQRREDAFLLMHRNGLIR